MDWHHRRNSLAMYWRQQKGYGKAEALLEQKWPERYNALGHLAWGGRLYGRGFTLPIPSGRSRIYGGVWGSAAYQSLYEPAPLTLLALPLMPEWWYLVGALTLLVALGLSWPPLLALAPLWLLALAAPLAQAAAAAARATFPHPPRSRREAWQRRALVFFMHLQQPIARLIGRRQHGLTPWRRRGAAEAGGGLPATLWSETWRAPEDWVAQVESALRRRDVVVLRGDATAAWDLEVRGGLAGSLRARFAVEEHGGGRQLLRWQAVEHTPVPVRAVTWGGAGLGLAAAVAGAPLAAVALVGVAALAAWRSQSDLAHARRAWAAACREVAAAVAPQPAPAAVDLARERQA
jgi:hypothetical protein